MSGFDAIAQFHDDHRRRGDSPTGCQYRVFDKTGRIRYHRELPFMITRNRCPLRAVTCRPARGRPKVPVGATSGALVSWPSYWGRSRSSALLPSIMSQELGLGVSNPGRPPSTRCPSSPGNRLIDRRLLTPGVPFPADYLLCDECSSGVAAGFDHSAGSRCFAFQVLYASPRCRLKRLLHPIVFIPY